MSLTGTPSPWHVYQYRIQGKRGRTRTIIQSENKNVCTLDVAGRINSQEILDFDAKLLAASPELLEVVEAFVWVAENMESAPLAASSRLFTAHAQAKQIIQKIKGI